MRDLRTDAAKGLVALAALCSLLAAAGVSHAGDPASWHGRVLDETGAPVMGAMVSVRSGDPLHAVTVFTDDAGAYRVAAPAGSEDVWLRVRRIGWKDLRVASPRPDAEGRLDLRVERERDPAALAAQLPANHWYALVLERVEDDAQREELKRQCTYCHQQGSAATRVLREHGEWEKVIRLMGRMGGMLSGDLRSRLPDLMNAAYDPAHAVPALTKRMGSEDFAPPPPPLVRRARIDEWELGERSSMQHDLMVHPDGRVYSVDMTHDRLYRLDPGREDGLREAWDIPRGDLPLGGVLRSVDTPLNPNSNSHVGPHSLQAAPDGAVWITLALGNQLARFDPDTEDFEIHRMDDGYYPHTLRFDGRGRIWYTIAASNHVGMLDPKTGEARQIRVPAASFGQAVALRMMPLFLWLGRHFDIRSLAAEQEDGISMPVPYGIDIAPDGGVWFSQLNQHRIGRIDPDDFSVEMVDTPFAAPRRLRFDSQGKLWIPSFSESLVARFDPDTREFERWPLPIEPLGSEVPYALAVEPGSDRVWICGTNSDTLIRFDPGSETFTVYPLPTRVTYTREVDFDAEGRIWTSNSNAPTWQIETGIPRVLRLSTGG
ncbi:MAG: virginiamycin B lyase family protein [Myxococcota bacterium]